MRAVIIETPGNIRVENVADPTPKPDELVIRVGACGICGTDLHIANGGLSMARYPIVPGHEAAGEVVAMGSNFLQTIGTSKTKLAIGARVAIDPNRYCGYCTLCRTGRENLCVNYGCMGVTTNGAFAQYVTVPTSKAYVLPETFSFQEAALLEPTSCAVHGMHRLNPKSGDTFLIVGAGTMGLLLMQLAVHGGASKVAVVDLNTQRLQLAATLGASVTHTDINKLMEEEPEGFDCVIDVTGVPRALEGAFAAVKRGGKLMAFGVAPSEARISLPQFQITTSEITILGSQAILFSIEPAIRLVSSGIINAKAMLTTTLSLEDFPTALDMVRKGEGVKTQIVPNG